MLGLETDCLEILTPCNPLIPRLDAIFEKEQAKIDRLRTRFNLLERNCKNTKEYENYINKILKAIKENGVANCKELSALAQAEFIKLGKAAQRVLFIIFDKSTGEISTRRCPNHYLTITGLKQSSDLTKPKTWGDIAVTADPFFKLVGKSDDVLNKILCRLKYNPESEDIIFYEANPLEKDLIAKMAKKI